MNDEFIPRRTPTDFPAQPGNRATAGWVRCDPTPAERLAGNLRQLRAAHGMSLTRLAKRSGVSTATLCGLEAGRGNPTLATLLALAPVLGIPAGDLITDASQARRDPLGWRPVAASR